MRSVPIFFAFFLCIALSATADEKKHAEPEANYGSEPTGPNTTTVDRNAAPSAEEVERQKLEALKRKSAEWAKKTIADPKGDLSGLEEHPDLKQALESGKLDEVQKLVGSDAKALSNIYTYQKDFGRFFKENIKAIKAGNLPKGTEELIQGNTRQHGLAAKEIAARTGESADAAALRLQKIQNLLKADPAGAGRAMSELMSTLRDRQELATTLKTKAGSYALSEYFEKAATKEKALFTKNLQARLLPNDAFTRAFGEHWEGTSLPHMKQFNDWVRAGAPNDPKMVEKFGRPTSWGNWAVSARNPSAVMTVAGPPSAMSQLHSIPSKYFTGKDGVPLQFRDVREVEDFFRHAESKLANTERGKDYSAFYRQEIARVSGDSGTVYMSATVTKSPTASAPDGWSLSSQSPAIGLGQILSEPGTESYYQKRLEEQSVQKSAQSHSTTVQPVCQGGACGVPQVAVPACSGAGCRVPQVGAPVPTRATRRVCNKATGKCYYVPVK